MKNKTAPPPASHVLQTPAADPREAAAHFARKLSLETDPSDVRADLERGERGFVLVDTRSPEAFAQARIPGAINLWHRVIDEKTAAALPKDRLVVAYCAGVNCNASTKGAAKLAALGFRVKEMIGGLESWRNEGYPVEEGRVRP